MDLRIAYEPIIRDDLNLKSKTEQKKRPKIAKRKKLASKIARKPSPRAVEKQTQGNTICDIACKQEDEQGDFGVLEEEICQKEPS